MTSSAILVTVNGEVRRLARESTVSDVVAAVGSDTARGLAVAVNNQVVPRREWPTTTLRPDDQVEVLTAVQGG